jgi:DNA-directed RNA polymerase specialized sigma24 family protein
LPALVDSIAKALAHRGVAYEAAEDIAQEVAARVVAQTQRSPDPFASLDHLYGWGFLTAWRLAADRWRQQTRHAEVGEWREVAVGSGLDQRIQYRAATGELLAAIRRLSKGQQRALGRILRNDFPAMQEFLAATDALTPGERAHLQPVLDYLALEEAEPEPELSPATERWGRHDVRERLRGLVQNFPAALPRFRVAARGFRDRLLVDQRWVASVALAGATAAVSLLATIERHAANSVFPADPLSGTALAASTSAVPVRPTHASAPHHLSPSTPPPPRPRFTPGNGTLRVLTFPEPNGGTGAVNVVPNAPSRPLICTRAYDYGACVGKPHVGLPLLSSD